MTRDNVRLNAKVRNKVWFRFDVTVKFKPAIRIQGTSATNPIFFLICFGSAPLRMLLSIP